MVALIFIIIGGCIWGFATNAIIDNKGYDENWFWWGFFFGIVAMLVALSKPQINQYEYLSKESIDADRLNQGGWKCICGRTNPSYCGTCGCGRTKADQKEKNDTKNSIDELKKLKELLDDNAITNDEFETMKKQLLKL